MRISLLFDTSTHVVSPDTPELNKVDLLEKVLQNYNRSQHQSQKWFDARRLRLTSSKFGLVRRLKATTPPDNATNSGGEKPYEQVLDYGRNIEEEARQQYIAYQWAPWTLRCPSSFFIHQKYTFLGASPDGSLYDPSSVDPYGFLEIKCSFKYQDLQP